MSLGGFTLADRLGAKTKPCRVRGCSRTWLEWSGKSLGLGKGKGEAPAAESGLCDPCRKKQASLVDKERRCDVAGCEGKWIWTAAAQLEAFAVHKQPPKGLCSSCESKLATLEDKEIPCVVPGCTRTATLTRKAQLLAANQAERAAAAQAAHALESNGSGLAVASPVAAEAAPDEAGTVESTNGESTTAHLEAAPATEQAAGEADSSAAEGDAAAQTTDADKAGEAQAQGGAASRGDKPDKGDKPGRVTFEGAMCGPCHDVGRRLTDRHVTCGINGCKRKWIWKADEQIQAFAAGKPNEPPRRMCETCRASFGKLLDREVRCRTSGCKKTWTWSRFDQLDACQADKGPPKAPSRMCETCFQLFQTLKDVERPCRKPGCKRTWTDKRGAQLARAVRGRTGDPFPQYCTPCQKELGDLEDREIRCKTDGCTGTWTWTRDMQLKAGVHPTPRIALDGAEAASGGPGATAGAPSSEIEVAVAEGAASPPEGAAAAGASSETPVGGETAPGEGHPEIVAGAALPAEDRPQKGGRRNKKRRKPKAISPPERLCHACAEFLKEKKTLEIPCSQCGTPIFWPPESQLQSHLGNWATPSLCGACKRDATEAARLAAKEILRQQAMEHAAHPEAPPAATEAPPPETPPESPEEPAGS